MQADMAKWWDYDGAIKGAGVSSLGEALQPTTTATTVVDDGGKPLVTDGPFAETPRAARRLLPARRREPRQGDRVGAQVPGGHLRQGRAASDPGVRAGLTGSGRSPAADAVARHVPGRVRPRGGDPRGRARRGRRPRRGGRAGRVRRRAGPLAARRRAVHPGRVDPHHGQAPRDRPAAARGVAARQAGAARARARGGGARPARRGRGDDPRRAARPRLRLLPPGAGAGGPGPADAAAGRRPHRARDRPRAAAPRADRGAADGAREAQDPRVGHPARRAAARRARRTGSPPCSRCST